MATFKTVASASKTILDITDSYTVILSKETQSIACDSSGNALTGELGNTGKAQADIIVYRGATLLTPVASNPGLNQFSYAIGTPVNCTAARLNDDTFYLNTITADKDSGSVPITITIENDGVAFTRTYTFTKTKAGNTYSLVVNGGVRSITYNAAGGSPNPSTSTAYTATLYLNGVSVTPTTIAWTVNGLLTAGTPANAASYTPTIKTSWATGNNTYVAVTVTHNNNTFTETIPIAVTRDSAGIDWVADWDGLKTTIKGDSIISPKIFAGLNLGANVPNVGSPAGTASAPRLQGIAIGRDIVGGTDNFIGIVGYNTLLVGDTWMDNQVTFSLNTDGSAVFGTELGKQLIINSNGTLEAPEIDADKVTSGRFNANRLDLTGAITFSAFNEDLSRIFQQESGGLTYIDGSTIISQSIIGDQIDAKGLRVLSAVGGISKETFSIVSSTDPTKDGRVSIMGDVQSYDYVPGTEGWRIDAGGSADFNNTVVRGKVVLPNAGITNFADINQTKGRNLLKNTAMIVDLTGISKVGAFYTLSIDTVNLYNGINSLKIVGTGVSADGTQDILHGIYGALTVGQDGILKFNVKGSVATTGWIRVGGGATFAGGTKTFNVTTSWTEVQIDFGAVTAAGTVGSNTLVYGFNAAGTFNVNSMKLEYGELPGTVWSPAPEDYSNPVRIWAGTEEANKESAPFRVHQDGSIYAEIGTFKGVFSGVIDIGNIHIEDSNTTAALITVKTNDNLVTKVQIGEAASAFNHPFSVGSKFNVNPDTNIATISSRVEFIRDTNSNIVFPNDTSNNNLIELYENNFNISKDAYSTLLFQSNTSATTDFKFAKQGTANDVLVEVNGDLAVTNKIVLGNATIIKRTDGFDIVF